MPKLWEDPNVHTKTSQWKTNSHAYFDKKASIELYQKVMADMQKLSKPVDDTIAKFLNSGRLVDILTNLQANIDKFQAYPIIPQVNSKKLEDIYRKVKLLLPLELI